MVPDHHDTYTVQPDLKKNVEWKFLQIASPIARWIKMMALRLRKYFINHLIEFAPKTVT